jgi:phosphate starvation-inducible protein PhoH
VPGIDWVQLDGQDVIRHRLVKEIISRYDNEKPSVRITESQKKNTEKKD